MQESYPGINTVISEWKGQEITDFQEDLLTKVQAHISEKWFYNHIKTEHKSLPRIDVLNLLSKYVGYSNWDDFVYKNTKQKESHLSIPTGNRVFVVLPLVVILVMTALLLLFNVFSNREYQFEFYDAYSKELISNAKTELILLSETESPTHYLSDTSGRIVFETEESVVTMVVSAPYYKTDTILRILKKFDRDQKISLEVNDYALILHYFSDMNVDDWNKRRLYLNGIFDEGAIIYQVFNDENEHGMAIYNKTEFIDKLSMPTTSLRDIEILDVKYKNAKIAVVRFRLIKIAND